MLYHKKTKILATLGPSSSTEEIILRLRHNGMNAARLNFSHGTYEDHKKNIESIRRIEEKLKVPTAIIQDLQGPKIRLGNLAQEPVRLEPQKNITLYFGKEQTDNRIPVQLNIFPHLTVGNHIFINDGIIRLRVDKVNNEEAICTVMAGGEIRSHKGVNLPDTQLPNVALTEKDKKDLEFGIQHKVDYVAVSFVQDASDIETVRKIISAYEHQPKIIAKIETASAVKHLENIIIAADCVMVARGDLAVELGQEEVPIIQRTIIALGKKYNKPIIIATQMLESMITNAEPTRAEVNDVATAVLDEVDAVMLSAETAAGNYPTETVAMMDKIIKRVEKYFQHIHKSFSLNTIKDFSDQTTAIAAAASVLAHQVKAKKILTLTASGKTPLRIASYRPLIPIHVLTDNLLVYRQLNLVWGVTSYYLPKIETNENAYEYLEKTLLSHQELEKNDKIVLVTGTHPGKAGHTNIISVTRIGEK